MNLKTGSGRLKSDVFIKWIWFIAGLIAPMTLQVLRALNELRNGKLFFDSVQTYLPLAKSLLADPEAFFASEQSFRVAPGTYIFMALHRANVDWLTTTDQILSLLVIAFLFDTGRRLAGRWAGAGAAWLYAASPLLIRFSIWPQSEPTFFFGTAAWIWAMVTACSPDPEDRPQIAKARQSSILVALFGGVALGIATLTRGTYMYWIPIGTALSLFILAFSREKHLCLRRIAPRLLLIHILAFVMVAGWMLHNRHAFGKLNIATGAGAALFFGNNPVSGGYPLPDMGLNFDAVLVTDTHLSIHGDEILKSIAIAMIRDTPMSVSLPMYWRKLGAFLFFSKAHLKQNLFNDRAWRIMLLGLAALGVWSMRHRPTVWFVFGPLMYQILVHIPVLYNKRYSVGAIELPLTLLAGLGVAAVARAQRPWTTAGYVCVLLLVGIMIGAYHQKHTGPVMPDLSKGPHRLVYNARPEDIKIRGLNGNPLFQDSIVNQPQPAIVWRNATLIPPGHAIVKLGVDHIDSSCRELTYLFKTKGEPLRKAAFRLDGLGPNQDILYGTKRIVRQNDSMTKNIPRGTLVLTFQCPIGARLRFNELAVYHANVGEYYRNKIYGNNMK